MKTKTAQQFQLINIVAFVAVVLMNFLSNALPINGRSAGQISDALPSYFTPAGYTFSIWGLIYLALLGFTIYQALPGQRNKPFLSRIGWLFAASSATNIVWLLTWHYGYYRLSVFVMLSLLLILISIYSRLDIGRPDPALSLQQRLLVQAPFSLYLGWISVATVANSASVLAYVGWDGFGLAGPTWSAVMMFVVVALAALMLNRRRNLAYAAVLIWALFGIRAAYPTIAIIANSAVVAAILIAALALGGYLRTRQNISASNAVPQTG